MVIPLSRSHSLTQTGRYDAVELRTNAMTISRKPVPQYQAGSLDDDGREEQKLIPESRSEPSSGKSHRRLILLLWWPELLGCLLAISALCTIVAVLYPRRGLPLPHWPYRISINAIIAILVTIFKVAILMVTAEGISHLKFIWFKHQRPLVDLETYDKASRGPFGSLSLLFLLRHHHVGASIGATITLLALAVEPFTQQVLRYESCSVLDSSGNSGLPRSNSYAAMGQHIGANLATVRMDMQSAINAGVYNVNPLKVSITCSTGNCTFAQPYHTVGYCSSCTDITDQLTFNLCNETYGENKYHLDCATQSITYSFDPYQVLNVSLSSGLWAVRTLSDQDAPINSNHAWFIMRPNIKENNIYTGSSTAIDMILTHSDTKYEERPWAARCFLYPCVKTYTSEVKKGILTENTADETPWIPVSIGDRGEVDVSCLTAHQREALINQGYAINEDTHWIHWNVTPICLVNRPDDCPGTFNASSIVPLKCTYTMYEYTWSAVNEFLKTFFNGSITPYGSAFQGPSVLQAFYNDGGISFDSVQSIFANVAESMTTNIRQAGNTSLWPPAVGTVWRQDTCVHVHWQWLAFPAALFLMTVCFLSLILVGSHHKGGDTHDWKSSPLPIMFHGLDHNTVAKHRNSKHTQTKTMRQIAKDVYVQFSNSEDGWEFKNRHH